MELKRIFAIFLKRKWLALQALVVILGMSAAITFLMPPTYETVAKILYEPPETESTLLKTIGISNLFPQLDAGRNGGIETKVNLAQVDPILEEVILRLQLRDSNGVLLDPSRLCKPGLLAALLPSPYVAVTQDAGSNLISVTARSSDADEAQQIANTLAGLYIERNGEGNRKRIRNMRQFVSAQLDKVKAEYHSALERLAAFRKEHNTIDLDFEAKAAIEKIGELMKEKEENIVDIDQLLAKIQTLKKQLKDQGSAVTTTILRDNPQIEELKKRLADLRSQLANLLTEKTSSHPDAVAIRKQIEELEGELKQEVAAYLESVPELNDLEKQLAAQRAHLAAVNKDIEHYVELFKRLPETSKEAEKLKLALTSSQSLFSSLLDYGNQIGIAEALAINDLRLAQAAPRPIGPKSPKKALNLIAGTLLGLVFGFGLALVCEYTDDTIKTADDLGVAGAPPLLGAIPKSPHRLISRVDPNDPLCEAYRTIRNSLEYAGTDGEVSSLLVTSSGPLEGRTTVVANLGISYARANKQALVVDTDLRRPHLHRLFRVSNDVGLTQILAGTCTIGEALQPTGIENLSVLTSGPTPLDPGVIIESARLERLIEVLCRRYEVVILDSAPLLVKSDAAVIAHHVGGTIHLVQAGKITKSALLKTGELFEKAGIVPVGAVLNRFREERETASLKKGPRARLRAMIVLAALAAIALGATLYQFVFRP